MENKINTEVKVKTETYTINRSLAKLDPDEAAKVTEYAVGDKLPKNAIDIKLVEVKQEGKNVTEHFELEKDGSEFMLYFDEEMTQKALASGKVLLKVTIKEMLEL
ncbi:hypothetical protein INF23_05905 [Ligilactobacillus salivarius]|uniref:hypothetical protein n=1 Tax=Ligilactobacillus salivarius TaxID=1624 RepID=UPI001875713C|nr:hypothetical protein [Ligilactobacillus salivarius]MBE5067139.1 hypothetical protein [Ligilactobacillus salivarius]